MRRGLNGLEHGHSRMTKIYKKEGVNERSSDLRYLSNHKESMT